MIRVALFERERDFQLLVATVLRLTPSCDCDVVVQSENLQLVEDILANTIIDVLYISIEPKGIDLERIVKIRETYPNLGIVIYSNLYSREEVIGAGADLHLRMPVSPQNIVDAVQSAYTKHK
jgi:DNA-binding NarL/FixJ family response regulator